MLICLNSLFVTVVLLTLTSKGSAQSNNFHAASCVSSTIRCTPSTASKSRVCRPKVWATVQKPPCAKAACNYCSTAGNKAQKMCNTIPMRRVCGKGSSPMSAPKSAPKPRGKCSYRPSTGNAIVIGLGGVKPRDGWTRSSRNGYKGLIFHKELGGGRQNAGKAGLYCFPITAKASGTYQLTALTYSGSFTEHNDMWLRSSMGFSLWMNGRYYQRSSDWLKGYQNNAANGIADYIVTKDWDPHRFMLTGVQAGKTFSVCMSGRSYRFEIYQIIIKKCSGLECRGGKMGGMMKLPTSRCA